MRKLRVALLACLALGAPCASATTLEEVLVRVYLTSPRLESARARLRAVDEDVPRALAGWRPRLGSTTGAGVSQTQTNEGARTLGTLRQALTLSQPVYSGGATRADTGRAENAVRAERARLAATEQEVLLEVVEAYTAVARDQAVLDLARRNERRLEEQLKATRDRYRFGELTRTDVAQAETRLARGRADHVRAEGELDLSTARYHRAVGEPPDDLAPAAPLADPALADAEVPAIVETTPGVLAARFSLDAARDEIDLARADLRPRLSLDGQVGYEREPSTLLDYEAAATIGARLSVPLYQGGGEYARVRQARQAAVDRRHALDDARRAAEEELTGARAALRAVVARIRALEAQVAGARLALDGVRQEALVGARTVIDVLDAEQELFAADVELARARRDEVVASYRLRAALGRLSVKAIDLPVEPYDDEAYYREVRDKWAGVGEDRDAQ
jgi:TolC family type I secretion outer membrane protein